MKFVLVSGGVVSGLGKGITASSIGLLLKQSGLRITCVKIDPYLNIDAGTMSPYEHGECFVLDDGGEVDLDLGNYERFLDVTLTSDHNMTTGKMYQTVLAKERKGDYLGKTVQIVPHVTDAIQHWIEKTAAIPVDKSGDKPDVCMIELGGTVGDIESMVFLEALRQMQYRVGADNFCHVHVSLVPAVGGEQKSKPIQHSVQTLRAVGLPPHIIVCRTFEPLSRSVVEKISLFCMVSPANVVSVHDVKNIYQVPLVMLEKRVPSLVLGALHLNRMPPENVGKWAVLAKADEDYTQEVIIAIVGKYTGLSDSYLSVIRSLGHAAVAVDHRLKISWVESSFLEDEFKQSQPVKYEQAWTVVKTANGILVPGGFGSRGFLGMLAACRYARENKIPFFGICLGLQIAVIEHARNVVGWDDATSTEFDAQANRPVIVFMPEVSKTEMGGTMRLGARESIIKPQTLASHIYNYQSSVMERHRHRYEVNSESITALAEAGLVFSATDDTGTRMEIIELPVEQHPFFFAVQFHPELKSRPTCASPPFLGFLQAATGKFKFQKGKTASQRFLSSSPVMNASICSASASNFQIQMVNSPRNN